MLRLTLAINADTIADYEIRNTGEGPSEYHVYEVREIKDNTTGPVLFKLLHKRFQGAHTLARLVLERLTI